MLLAQMRQVRQATCVFVGKQSSWEIVRWASQPVAQENICSRRAGKPIVRH